ncbi:radical SAM protein [Streptomyces sp. NPDC002867]
MRVSSYVIGAPLKDERFFVLLHGIRGTLDKVAAVTGAYLVDHRGGDADSPPWESSGRIEAHLLERGYLTNLSAEQEREAMVEIATVLHQADLESNPPNFVFVPAYTCNLRCPYCFQSHEMHAGRGVFATVMTREAVDDAFRVIDDFDHPGALARQLAVLPSTHQSVSQSSTGRRLGLFGGEPMQESTREIVEYITERANERGSTLWAITNGVQLDLFADLLGPDGVAELQITLDGLSVLHDRRRVGPKFRQTFDKIIANIGLALDANTQVRVRINVDRSNADHVAQLNDMFVKLGWSDHPAFSATAAVVTGDGKHEPLVSPADLLQVTSALNAEGRSCVSSYEGYARNILERTVAGSYPFQSVANCSAETGLLMFDPRGDVYSCWDDVGLVDRRIGSYSGGLLDLDKQVARSWLSRFPGAIEECSRCPYALIHTSGCASMARANSDSIFAAACEGFQHYFPRTLADSYNELENQLLSDARPIPKHSRSLPIVQVTSG